MKPVKMSMVLEVGGMVRMDKILTQTKGGQVPP